MFTWLCVSPMHFFFHFENLQYNYHAQTRVWDWESGPPQFNPPPSKKRNLLNLDLPWSGGGPPPPPPPKKKNIRVPPLGPPHPYLGKLSGSRHHYTTSFIKVRPGRVAQSVTCLATDACLTADQGVASSIPARYQTSWRLIMK